MQDLKTRFIHFKSKKWSIVNDEFWEWFYVFIYTLISYQYKESFYGKKMIFLDLGDTINQSINQSINLYSRTQTVCARSSRGLILKNRSKLPDHDDLSPKVPSSQMHPQNSTIYILLYNVQPINLPINTF